MPHYTSECFLERSSRITEVRLTPSLLGDGPLTDPVLAKLFHFRHEFTYGHWLPMRFPVLSGLINSCFHPVPQNIPFEFGKHGQHACESAGTWGG